MRKACRYAPSNGDRSRETTWPWILQRLTGLAIVIVLFLHLWLKHFGNPGKVISFSQSSEQLRQPIWLVVAFLMIGLLLFHSLNGSRNVLMDYITGRTVRRVMAWSFLGVGVVFFFLYLLFLMPFVSEPK